MLYNRENQILEQYPFEVKQTVKGRGALICDTDKGLKILKEYRGSQGLSLIHISEPTRP